MHKNMSIVAVLKNNNGKTITLILYYTCRFIPKNKNVFLRWVELVKAQTSGMTVASQEDFNIFDISKKESSMI